MSIGEYTRKDGTKRFWIDHRPDGYKGRRKRETLPASIQTREEADEFERLIKRAEKDPDDISLALPTDIKELIPQYLAWYALHRSPSTLHDISMVMDNHIERLLGKVHITELNHK